ncbi:hypothetical protein DNH61_10950 [Paenibacillus sambharensis]|uniref:Radical SAM protein n=1 Tax=Paenibacillus sambharensis TaxID=1803190 RepID=A0A2W1LAW1_9BACL|nr:hypothetical protein [Paenibacillus sambharensis]PZD96033.1 hypothetical protein DNH61_10950 [Paenibacillus sambharensis]
MGNHVFKLDARLGIELPVLGTDWERLSVEERSAILEYWETIRGTIPDRIFALERLINKLQARLNEEEDFDVSCKLNSDIAEQASRINDLHIWYRVNQEIETRRHSG